MRDVLRTFFFDLLSGRDTHKKKERAVSGFRGDAFEDGCCSLRVCSEREREREIENGVGSMKSCINNMTTAAFAARSIIAERRPGSRLKTKARTTSTFRRREQHHDKRGRKRRRRAHHPSLERPAHREICVVREGG